MARNKAELVDQMDDDAPALGRPEAVAVSALSPGAAAYPWAFLVRHPGYGAMRVRKDQAKTAEEAKEAYRRAKCPHIPTDILDRSGFRVDTLAFRPAATEVGK